MELRCQLPAPAALPSCTLGSVRLASELVWTLSRELNYDHSVKQFVQQTTALFLPTTVTRTGRHKEPTKKLTHLRGKLCCAREHSVQFFVQFLYTVKLHSLT
jgi:hypothetical protein